MDIGLHSGAITSVIYSGTGSSGGGGSQEPAGLTPIPGILDAPNVIVLGASIMDSGFGHNQTLRAGIADYAQAAGFTGTLHVRSQAGDDIADCQARLTAAQVETGIAATEGQNLYLVHIGGNAAAADHWHIGSCGADGADQTALSHRPRRGAWRCRLGRERLQTL